MSILLADIPEGGHLACTMSKGQGRCPTTHNHYFSSYSNRFHGTLGQAMCSRMMSSMGTSSEVSCIATDFMRRTAAYRHH